MKYPLHAALIAASLTAAACAAPLTVTAVPNGTRTQIRERLTPLAHALSHALDQPVRFSAPGSIVSFGTLIQQRRPAVIFAGPQILAWATQYGYQPVLAARGTLRFVLVTRSRRVTGKSLASGQPVCGLPPPNLATLTLFARYPDLLRQPYLVMVSSPQAALQGVASGRCRAASVPIRLLRQAPQGPWYTTFLGQYPNFGFAVSDGLPAVLRARIAQALVNAARTGALRRLQKANAITGWRVPGPHHFQGHGYAHLVSGILGYATPPAQAPAP